MNLYLDWIYCKITCVEEMPTVTFEGEMAYNFLRISFKNIPPIEFSKKFIRSKGIKIEDVSIGKVLCIEPKTHGEILGTHMINDLELRKRAPKVWKHLRIVACEEMEKTVRVSFKNGLDYVFSKKFLDFKKIKIGERKIIQVKEKGGYIYDIR